MGEFNFRKQKDFHFEWTFHRELDDMRNDEWMIKVKSRDFLILSSGSCRHLTT